MVKDQVISDVFNNSIFCGTVSMVISKHVPIFPYSKIKFPSKCYIADKSVGLYRLNFLTILSSIDLIVT